MSLQLSFPSGKKADEKVVEVVKDAVVLEQFLSSLLSEARMWVRERGPKLSRQEGELADRYW